VLVLFPGCTLDVEVSQRQERNVDVREWNGMKVGCGRMDVWDVADIGFWILRSV
jgi:hypothetical protein